jgi:acylphosphatase
MDVCKRIHYWGTVQGVGFRMTTKRVAARFAVTGYVRNLADGQVEVVVQGDAAEVERFLGAVAERMGSYIQGHEIEDVAEPPISGFEIRM